ncbi:ATP-dependent RecD-like DNA helicase [Bacillus sp. AFS077874]|uniref:SF1B family DNA helicase RecD2 n=1 Tax=Bacillus sp. AFS077874 TaxID=2033513 RepID=UPI000BF49DCA|nr:ATP-dependent RecD-like DNA helicase [Bacillus sp. AFS077874]PFM76057.1 ATP-dependent RecD-like DNA helicase [Bacillus sp. AFS077874]
MQTQSEMELFVDETPYIKGHITTIIFYNAENFYTVAKVKVVDTNLSNCEQEMTITGNIPRMNEDETYTFKGIVKDHPRYGKQFQISSFEKELPSTKKGVIQYLSSDLFKGIGKKTAEKIVDHLGEGAINKILDNADSLEGVPGLAKSKAKEIYETILSHQGLEKVISFLSSYGIGTGLSIKIYKTYNESTLDVIRTNPFKLIEDVDGIGFGRADEIGRAIGITGNHPDRIRAGCIYILEHLSMQEGHVYITQDQFIDETRQLLMKQDKELVEAVDISREMKRLIADGKLVMEDERIYLSALYYAEKGIVNAIRKLLSGAPDLGEMTETRFAKELEDLESKMNVKYAPSQAQAIKKAMESAMMVLTGGPGTGKTTVIKGIVNLFSTIHDLSLDQHSYPKDDPFPYLLAAPTGRAAKRMSEATGLPAVTIHRLLGWTREGEFSHHEENPLNGKLLIIDEFSMVDVWLGNQLLKSIPEGCQVIFVGDEDQLPSVGPGQVLKDLLNSGTVPTVRLKDIYRQSEDSSIITLAHYIKDGTISEDLFEQRKDRSFIGCSSQQVVEVVKKVCENANKKGFPVRDIQVLAPMYRGPAGIDALNEGLQEVFNPKKEKQREMNFGDTTFRTGDKVLQLVNVPENNVFNGDMGEIVNIFFAKENVEQQDIIIVSFDGNEVTYTRPDFSQLTLAYCCSIHKSQGSEFDIIVLPIVKSYYRMLRRNLIYTAVTRSKKFLIMCGEQDAFIQGIGRTDDGQRQTTLRMKLKGIENGEVQLNEDLPFQLSDELPNLSPYDFM